jgi:hypothetical protein
VILRDIDLHQLNSCHLRDDSSLSSTSGWASRRDSSATNTSQASSAGTSAVCPSPSLVEKDALNATLKQGLGILSPGLVDDLSSVKTTTGTSDLVPSTPWASSLVIIRPPRESSLPRRVVELDEEASSATYQNSVLPAYSTTTKQNTTRSNFPSFGFNNLRRPSETPSYASSQHSSTCSDHQASKQFSTASILHAKPVSSSSSSSLTDYTMNKLRNVRSTPLLRRKLSSNIEGSMQGSNGGNDTTGGPIPPPNLTMGQRKGSLPDVPLKRVDNGIRRRASFLPISMRRGSQKESGF